VGFPPAFLVSMYTRARARNSRPRRTVSTEDAPETCPQSSVPDGRLGWRSLYPGFLRLSAHRLNINHLLSRVVLYAISPDNKNPRFAGVLSPLPDSNRGPPPYHGGFDQLLCDVATALDKAFSCNSAGFSASSTPVSGDPKPPRKPSNLSPRPSPTGGAPQSAASAGRCVGRAGLAGDPTTRHA
jgi:hypothetical protein